MFEMFKEFCKPLSFSLYSLRHRKFNFLGDIGPTIVLKQTVRIHPIRKGSYLCTLKTFYSPNINKVFDLNLHRIRKKNSNKKRVEIFHIKKVPRERNTKEQGFSFIRIIISLGWEKSNCCN